MDWKFTLATLFLFPSCIVPIQIFGKRARQAVQSQQENMGQMVVTMQETFAGIRVVKSFAREDLPGKKFFPEHHAPIPPHHADGQIDGADGAVDRSPGGNGCWDGLALRLYR